jgi:drug/metabolite transporter (DMT)-like permease
MIIFLSYIYYFIASSANSLHIRYLTKKRDLASVDQIRFTFHTFLILCLGSLFFPIFSSFHLSGNRVHLVLLSLVCGVFGMGCSSLSTIAQKHLDAGVTSLTINIYTPVTIVLSSVFLHEGLTPLQIVGTFLLLFALVIVSKKHRIGRFSFDKYFIYMILSGVLLGVLLVSERALQNISGFSAGTMMSWWSQTLFLGLLTLFTKSRHTYTNTELFGYGLIRFLSATSYVILVYIVGNLSLVSSITTFKVVIMFIAGALVLNEREDLPRKIIGSIIAVAGLLLMK